MQFLVLTTLALSLIALLSVMQIYDGKLKTAKVLVSFSLCLIYYHVCEWLDEKGLR